MDQINNNVALQMSLSKVFKTNSAIINAVICICIPIFLQCLLSLARNVYDLFEKCMIKSIQNTASRHIIYRYRDESPSWFHKENINRNDILQKAVMMYVSHIHCSSEIKFDDSDISFIALESEADTNSRKPSQLNELRKLRINYLPSENIWANLKNDIRLKISDGIDDQTSNSRNNGDEPMVLQRVKDFHFRANNPNGSFRIDMFLDEAVDWYIKSLNQVEDNNRYLYIAQNQNESDFVAESKNDQRFCNDSSQKASIHYKRYALSDSKKLSNLFFPQKETLKSLLDNFINRQGKYEIDGYPHKLGLLLWGEPGTGKTSLIRAVAHYTQRNIVSVNLSQIKTNQQLMDIVFNEYYSVSGLEFPVKLSFSNIIFIFEDIDACADVVLSRSTPKKNNSIDGIEEEKSNNPLASTVAAVVAAINNKSYEKDKKDQEMLLDKLNLSGLLNVLDGIVDTPNRIIVMTTNHPEKLDSALIRPGRIDKCIYMGYMKSPAAIDMIKHYFSIQDLDVGQIRRLEELLGVEDRRGTLKCATPAFIEQKCAECLSVNELLDCLSYPTATMSVHPNPKPSIAIL